MDRDDWAMDLQRTISNLLDEAYEDTRGTPISDSYLGDKVRIQTAKYEWRSGTVGNIFEPTLIYFDPHDDDFKSRIIAEVFLMENGEYAIETQNMIVEMPIIWQVGLEVLRDEWKKLEGNACGDQCDS